MQPKDKQNAGFLAHKGQACPEKPTFNKNQAEFPQTKNQADPAFVLPPYQGVTLLDPSIIYSIQLTNAAADQIFKMRKVLEALEPYKVCGYSEHIDALGAKVTDVVDALINFASAYAKMSV